MQQILTLQMNGSNTAGSAALVPRLNVVPAGTTAPAMQIVTSGRPISLAVLPSPQSSSPRSLSTSTSGNMLVMNGQSAYASQSLPSLPRSTSANGTMPIFNIGGLGPTADAYKQYDQRTHVYMKPDMYIGGDTRSAREEWLYDLSSGKMSKAVIDFVPGSERIYLEILSNASDNVGRSRRANIDPGRIDIIMSNSTISITNFGLPMPIEINQKTGLYVPQMVFGNMLTSSNYEVDRHEVGTNGIGAKATNIFSTEFTAVVHDAVRHLKYTQVWTNNMKNCSTPVIEQYAGKESSVQIIYVMDFARFGYDVPGTGIVNGKLGPIGGYTQEAFCLFARHAIDISFTAKIPVSFNGTEFNYSNIRDYARLYFGDAVDTAIVHYQWPPNTEIITKKKGYQVAKNPTVVAEVELIAIDTPDDGHHVSFVNCMMTRDGGVHVNAAVKAVGDSAVQMINESTIKRLTKQNKGKELDAKDKRSHTITIADVKPHISILLAVRVVNPKFTSQSKTALHAPVPKIEVSEEELRNLGKWQLIDRLYAALEAKQFASMSKTDGKLKGYVRLQSGVDANFAGKAERQKCVLYITEGKSGAGYANTLLGLVRGGRDYIGVLPMRGKSLNVMNADRFQIEKNNEINELKKMLGLCEGLDYTVEENFNRMRYGHIMIMADADMDGKHIIGLIINFFHCRFPSLLARGFVMYYRTPIIRVWHGKTVKKFYMESHYEAWKRETPNYATWKHKYYKGLAGSKDADVKDDYAAPRVVNCFYDADAPRAMALAFDKKQADRRKEWIANWRDSMGIEDVQMQPISMFIDHELILFSIANVHRSIPKLMDGFKESLRKIMHGAHLHWKISPKDKEYAEFKVGRLGYKVAETCGYHHGETILADVITGMAQDFVGANNMPWFTKDGQFGTRFQGGKDAGQVRYTSTRPERMVGLILRKEDRPILQHLQDEGETIEPVTYYPVIPMVLVNGAEGIATGYSTTIPKHNPLDLMDWLRKRLNGKVGVDLPDIIPWYRGFNGTLKLIDRRFKKKPDDKINVTTILNVLPQPSSIAPTQITQMQVVDDSAELDAPEGDDEDEGEGSEDEEPRARPLLSLISLGNFHFVNDQKIVVTELPIGLWPITYLKWLEDLKEKNLIKSYRNCSVGDEVYFEIDGFTETPNHRTLRLQRSIGMSNMVLLDDDNRPRRYDTSEEILETFYQRRLPIYQKRKDYILSKFKEEIVELQHKIRFIRAIITGEIVVIKGKKPIIREQMDKLGIPRELLETTKIVNCTEEEITELTQTIATKEAQYLVLEATTPNQMWLKDLDELEAAYCKIYGIKRVAKAETSPRLLLQTTGQATVQEAKSGQSLKLVVVNQEPKVQLKIV